MACGDSNSYEKDIIEIVTFDECSNPSAFTVDFNHKDSLKKYFKESRVADVETNETIMPAKILRLRKYQDELATYPLQGFNTIICAPTGSGKTIVAVKVIIEHLRKAKLNNENRKVVFLVPTVSLVDQQTDVLTRYLPNEYTVSGIKGGPLGINKISKKIMLHQNDVSIMTPQLLLNVLVTDDDLDLPMKITDFSLIIFDECHHTDKGHSYNEIMAAYFDIKFDKNRNDKEKLPQVVGLTASLGVGQADALRTALKHIIKVCANLDAEKLVVVDQCQEELAQFVNGPIDEVISVPCGHLNHPFSVNIAQIMQSIERLLEPIFDYSQIVKIKPPGSRYPPTERWSPPYTNWISDLYYFAPKLLNTDMKLKLTTYMEHLRVYHTSLIINAHLPTRFALEYINDAFKVFIQKQTTSLDESLIALFTSKEDTLQKISKNPDIVNPIVNKLKEILLDEYKARSDSRMLIFVRTRELAKSLQSYINDDADLKTLKAGRLTGVNASKDEGGQTDVEQKSCLQKFRDGEYKVLVATTVAEEGIDIEKCNIVIKYNHVTNDIALIQRRGRGRAVGSKSILLTQEEWIKRKEVINGIREQLMKDAVKHINSKGDQWFTEEVKKDQIESFRERKFEELQCQRIRVRLENRAFDLKCKKCDYLITNSTKVRCIKNSAYVSVDPDIWNHLCIEPGDMPMIFEAMSIAGKISCVMCRNGCGEVIKYRKVYLPTLAIGSFTISNLTNSQMHHVRKWKQVTSLYFNVDPLALNELLPMYQALKNEELDEVLNLAALKMGLINDSNEEDLIMF